MKVRGVLSLNAGSTSVRWGLFQGDPPAALARDRATARDERAFDEALRSALEQASAACDAAGGSAIDAVAHRVVHGGADFRAAVAVDDRVLEAVERVSRLAPLHNRAGLACIRAARRAFPEALHVAVFDTAFHAEMPEVAALYAVERATARRLGIRRYGFHGISHAGAAARAAEHLGRPPQALRLVSLHLGGGASACAIDGGRSIDTSMGMTPLEGLVMATRSGDVDPGVVLALLRDGGMDVAAVDRLLNEHSGLAGLAGEGGDLRAIERRAADGDADARLAVSLYAYRARKYVGAYAVALGGLDAVLVTGAAGEHDAAMRARILSGLDCMGLELDAERNRCAAVSAESPVCEISAPASPVRALVVAADEERTLAVEALRVGAEV